MSPQFGVVCAARMSLTSGYYAGSLKPDATSTVREKGTGKPLKVETYTNSKGERIEIRKDNPKRYPDGGTQGSHFNAGPAGEKLRQPMRQVYRLPITPYAAASLPACGSADRYQTMPTLQY